MHQKGFSLIELAIVLAVLVVLAALCIPTICVSRPASRKTDCKNSLKQIGIYFALYESKYKAYPTPGAATWFRQLWRPDMATDGNLFRCAVIGKSGTGTHYKGITGAGFHGYQGRDGAAIYAWPASGISVDAPPDLPIACDDEHDGVPNHGRGSDCNVLFFEGRVDVFVIGSPTETYVRALLGSTTQGWAAPAGTR